MNLNPFADKPKRTVFLGSYWRPLHEWCVISDVELVACDCDFMGKDNLAKWCKDRSLPFKVLESPEHMQETLLSLGPLDQCMVAGFSYLLPIEVINNFKAVYNMHPGDLETNRGATPAIHDIMERNPFFTVQLHKIVDERLDSGPMVSKIQGVLNYDEAFLRNHERLDIMAGGLVRTLRQQLHFGMEVFERPWQPAPGSYRKRIDEELIVKLVEAPTINHFLQEIGR